MRLGYLVPEFPTQTHAFFWREASALKAMGCEIFYLSTRRPARLAEHKFVAEAIRLTKYVFPPRLKLSLAYCLSHPAWFFGCLRYIVGIENCSVKAKLRYCALILCAADLRLFIARQRVEHVHGHSAADTAHLLNLACRGMVTFSLTLHGDLSNYGTGHKAKFRQAKFVSVVTYDLQRQVIERVGLDESRLPMVRMGIDTRKFARVGKQGGPTQTFRFLTVARLNPAKGHVYALRAIHRLVSEGISCSYVIVGSGDHQRAIEDEIAALGLQDRVSLAGSMSEEEVIAQLEESDCFLLPSRGLGEAAPVAVMEAMAVGLPCIVSIIGGTPEMIQDERTGFLVASRDVDEMVAAMRKLAADPSLCKKIGDAARAYALEKFDSFKSAERLLAEIRGA